MRHSTIFILLMSAGLAACGDRRPPWAEGAVIRSEIPDGAGVQDLSNLPTRLLALHNRERSAVGAPSLLWDEGLARAAASYGPRLETLGRLAHSPPRSRPGQGENLWMGTAAAFSLEEMVGGWIGEKRLFRPGIFPNVSRSGHGADVAHYTQMIWGRTARVGCALRRAPRSDFLICRYSPAGNVVGERVP